MQETPNKLYTYEDYLKINDDNQYELIGGELILVPSPRATHQEVSTNLVYAILDFIRKNKLGKLFHAPFDVVLSETEKPQPDILFISANRLDIITEYNIKGAPDLVIEILSPSTASRDKVEKSRLYYKYGVKEYWIVDPDAKVVEVFTPGEKKWILHEAYRNDEILVSPLLPGLQINLVDIF
ncbi:MAG: restriction endonuclease [Peptococcaceae bacterium BRH_c4b]|nr:MAG: restriction endonuclease [Peptococcaceae bacterium BRH_c4b]